MKKYLMLITFLFGFISIHAQHISFMGIQLGQSERVVDRLIRQKGFRFVGINNVMLTKMYDGTFWHFEDTRLNTEVENGKVTAISLSPSYRIYNQMSSFNSLVSGLDRKYGNHRPIADFFTSSDFADRKGYYWKATGGFVVAYYAQNELNGEILISIEYLDNSNKQVIIEKGRKRDRSNDL